MSGIIFKLRNLGGLPRRERVVLKELAIFSDDKNIAWPRNQTLAKNAGYTEKSIRLSLQVLQELKLIEIIRTGHFHEDQFITTYRQIKLLPDNWSKYLGQVDKADLGPTVSITESDLVAKNISIAPRARNFYS